MQQLQAAKITFPCTHSISDNPKGFCDEIINTRKVFDRGVEQEIVSEIRRLNTVDPKSKNLVLLRTKLQELFPKYQTAEFISGRQGVVSVKGPRKSRTVLVVTLFILVFLIVTITLAAVLK